jgi:hypothetical protein
MYSMHLYYNRYMLESLGHELRTKMNINILKMVHLLLVYSYFSSSVTSFRHIKSPKYTKLL